MKYLFLLGRNKALSKAELEMFFQKGLGRLRDDFLEVTADPEVHETFINAPQNFLNRLGGTIKILKILKTDVAKHAITAKLYEIIGNHFQNRKGKWKFALSIIPKDKRLLKKLLINLKKKLKQEGGNPRFINKNFENISHVSAANEKLIEDGMDITVFHGAICETVAIQDFKMYGIRDYGKPFRAPKTGMLPPKLAQIMINLAVGSPRFEDQNDIVVVDPFSGTGTVLMEALLMGFNAYGFDTSETMVQGSKQNVSWLCERCDLGMKCEVKKKDARNITAKDIPQKDIPQKDIPQNVAIVTESYLGPPLAKFPSHEKLKEITEELEALYLDFFKNAKNCLQKGTPIVIAFPVFRSGKNEKRLRLTHLIEKIEQLGYRAPFKQNTLIYERPDQTVGREIVKFIPE